MRVYWFGLTLFFGSLALSQTTSPSNLPPIQPKPTAPVVPVTPTVRLEDSKTIQSIRTRGRLIVALDPQFAPFALRDDKGEYRMWKRTSALKVVKNDPLQAHIELLDKITDKNMHDIVAYLETLK